MTIRSGPRRGDTDRRSDVARAALRVLAASGSRGLTHRAVDAEAGLAQGSVNYYAPTRATLLRLAAEELFALDAATVAECLLPVLDEKDRGTSSTRRRGEAAIECLVDLIELMTSASERYRVLARYELMGEAGRAPALRELFAVQRSAFVAVTASLAAAGGCTAPNDHADLITVLVDALMTRQVVTGPGRLSQAQLGAALARLLASC